jgi:hypothetical protein
MRLVIASLAALCVSTAAMAQERGPHSGAEGAGSHSWTEGAGSLSLDAMTTPGRHFGLGYYITDGLSVRPSLGASFGQYGTEFNLGADVRYEVLPGHWLSPYATASFNYMRIPSLVQLAYDGSVLPSSDPNVARYGAGAGLRARLKHRLSVVGEGRVMNSALRDISVGSMYGQQSLQDGAHFEAALGLSYGFH